MAKQKVSNNETVTAATTTAAANSARTFKSVNGKTLGNDMPQGNITFVNASRLYKEGKTDVIMAEGVLEKVGVSDGKFGQRKQYAIRAENGDLIMVDGFGHLDNQMKKVQPGSYIQITFLGKEKVESGPRAGTEAYKAIVGVAE
jgi:hypothetical protein